MLGEHPRAAKLEAQARAEEGKDGAIPSPSVHPSLAAVTTLAWLYPSRGVHSGPVFNIFASLFPAAVAAGMIESSLLVDSVGNI